MFRFEFVSPFTCFAMMKFDNLRFSSRQIKDVQVLRLCSDLTLLLNWHRKSEALERWGAVTGEGWDGRWRGELRFADPDSRRSCSATLGSLLDQSPQQKQTIRMSSCCPFDPLDSPERQTAQNTVWRYYAEVKESQSVVQHKYLCRRWIVAAALQAFLSHTADVVLPLCARLFHFIFPVFR